MDGLSSYEVMLIQSTWTVALSAVTLGILWNARTLPVYLWCASGLLGSAYACVAFGPNAQHIYPTVFGQYLLGITVVGNTWLKAISIRLLIKDAPLATHLKMGVSLLVAILVVPLLNTPRGWFSILLTLAVATLLIIFARDAFALGRSMKLRNAMTFAALMMPQSILIIVSTLSAASLGQDPLQPSSENLPIGATIFTIVVSLLNNAVFISLLLDLHIRQRDDIRRELLASRVEQSRLAEREQLLADMHDGLGSQLATAKLKAESGELNQMQVAQLLRECMADLHLLVDSLRDQGDGLAAALADHRYRTERRLAGVDIELLWKVDLRDAPSLPPKVTIQVLRIIQEAINNTLRHAEARKITISASYTHERGFLIRVEDDGRGIPTNPTPHQGLRNMQRRARDLGATLTVKPGEGGRGTVVELAELRPSER